MASSHRHVYSVLIIFRATEQMSVWIIIYFSLNKSPNRAMCTSLFQVDEMGSCRLLIMLEEGPRCKVLDAEFFSAVWSDWYIREIFQRSFYNKNIKEKPTGLWHVRNTHITQSQFLRPWTTPLTNRKENLLCIASAWWLNLLRVVSEDVLTIGTEISEVGREKGIPNATLSQP